MYVRLCAYNYTRMCVYSYAYVRILIHVCAYKHTRMCVYSYAYVRIIRVCAVNVYLSGTVSYGLTAWGLASKSYLMKILVLQKRALRFIFSVERCEHAVSLFIHADILPLNFLYFKSVCCLMNDIRNRKVPSNILNLFSDTTSIHSYNTRSSSENKFYIKKSRLEIQKRAFSRVRAKIWNEMPASLRELPKKHFQTKLHSFLLDILKRHDDYIDISQITSALKTYH